MSQNKERSNPEMDLLKEYLGQYQKAKRRERQLERRLQEICDEMNRPIGGVGYSPVNKPQNQISMGAASFTFRKSEQETRIEEQRDTTAKDLLKVMDILDYLDKNSDERNALELYYIDGYKWDRVAREMNLSRSIVFDRQRAGLEKLLAYKRVQKILRKYEEEKGL